MRPRPVVGAVAGFLAAVAVLLVVLMLVRTWGVTESVQEGQRANTRTLELIESCTTAGGECYERGQENTANVIGVLNDYQRRVVALAVACADQPGNQTVEQVTRCVERGLRSAAR